MAQASHTRRRGIPRDPSEAGSGRKMGCANVVQKRMMRGIVSLQFLQLEIPG